MRIRRHSRSFALVASTSIIGLAGCAGYHAQTANTVAAVRHGSPDAALANLEAKNAGGDKDLLYFLEKGEVLRMKGSYEASRDQWLLADSKVRAWEDQGVTDPSGIAPDRGLTAAIQPDRS